MKLDTSNPYVGLRPFNADESILFFGRAEQTLELLERLHKHHFVAVVGSSGCGKSSLLRAGLLPGLKAGYLVDYIDKWIIAIMKPGQSPLYNLTESILLQINPYTKAEAIAATVLKIREEGADALLSIVKPAWKQQNTNIFLLVDQFEELFRFLMEKKDTAGKDEAADFVNTILELSQQHNVPFYVVITMRSDFIGDCTQFYGLPEAMNESQYLVPRINRVQLRTVIEGPAKLYGKKVDASLTSHLLNELQNVKDELPLLQHALMRIWDMEAKLDKNGVLGLEDYENIGGIENALSNHADEALAGMDEDELRLTKKIFQALTAIDENGRKTRRPATLSHLADVTNAGRDELLKIINIFIEDKRCFLVITRTHKGTDSIIDISHESLIRQWVALNKWVDEENESVVNYLRLSEDAELHKKGKKDFLTGSELYMALEWYNTFKPSAAWANSYKEGFEEYIAYLKQSEEEQTAKLRLEKKRRRNQRYLVFAIMAVILLFGIYATVAYINADNLKKITEGQYEAFLLHAKVEEIVDNDPTLALRLEEAALEKLDSPMIAKSASKIYWQNKFYKIIGKDSGNIYCAAFSPDGKTISTGLSNDTACLWDLNGNKIREFNGHSGPIISVVFSPDGKTILTASVDSTARLWDLKGNILHIFRVNSRVLHVAFSPDGKKILTGSGDNLARLWDLQGNILQEFKGHLDFIHSLSFSPDGTEILTGSADGTARLWDLKGNTLHIFKGHRGYVCISIFSPNGKTILTTAADSTARLWDLKGNMLQEFKGHLGWVYSAAFSPDGKTILTGSFDNTARLWDLEGNPLWKFKGHSGVIYQVAFSPDGKTILTSSEDSTVRLWELKDHAFKVFDGHSDYVQCVAFSPNGKQFLTCSNDSTARLCDIKGNTIQIFKGHNGKVFSVAFSPNANTILTGSEDKTVRLWDLKGTTLAQFKGHSDAVNCVAFSPDGKSILTGSADSTARLWDLKGHILRQFKGHRGVVFCAAFSPDGKTILTGSRDSTACLWDLTGNILRRFKGHSGSIYWAAFSPDGKTILTGSRDNTARLWDLNGNLLQQFKGHSKSVECAIFSTDGKTVLTGSEDKTARLWDLSGNILHEFRGHSGAILSVAFSPDGKTILTGSDDNTARLWEIAPSFRDFLKAGLIEPLSPAQKQQFGIK